MKVLEIILNLTIRIINVPIICLTIIIFILMSILLLFILIPLEAIIVMPIYYIVTGKWYYNVINYWFPVVDNIGTYFDHFPNLMLSEINLSKYYGRDKEH